LTQEYIINVAQVEELQMIKDVDEIMNIFAKAKSTIVQGGSVHLVRKNKGGDSAKFEDFTTAEDLERYKKNVFKYL